MTVKFFKNLKVDWYCETMDRPIKKYWQDAVAFS